MNQAFNIYCDESSVENQTKYFIIGAFLLPRNKKKEFLSRYYDVINQNSAKEFKWTKITRHTEAHYKEIVDLFFATDYVSFYCIVVDKEVMDLQQYHNNDNELAFYKFYYLLLKEKLHSNAKYYIYLDKKPVKEKNRVGVLTGFLKAYTSSSRTDCNIRHIQEYSSRENKLIQIADIFTGAVAAKFNHSSTSIPKVKIINYIEEQRKKPLTVSSSLSENKFNVFIWQPHGNR